MADLKRRSLRLLEEPRPHTITIKKNNKQRGDKGSVPDHKSKVKIKEQNIHKLKLEWLGKVTGIGVPVSRGNK